MGSFDDAIRQHLDLKRQHGADPSEVAHLEREALGHIHAHEAGGGASESSFDRDAIVPPGDVIDWSDGRRVEARRLVASEETAEIDMAALIGVRDVDGARQHAYDWSADEIAADIGDPASSFEWEMPARSRLRKAA